MCSSDLPKRLGGWAKLALKPGETRAAEVVIEPRVLAQPDGRGGWQIEAGRYEVLLAAHAADRAPQRLSVQLPALALGPAGRPLSRPVPAPGQR